MRVSISIPYVRCIDEIAEMVLRERAKKKDVGWVELGVDDWTDEVGFVACDCCCWVDS